MNVWSKYNRVKKNWHCFLNSLVGTPVLLPWIAYGKLPNRSDRKNTKGCWILSCTLYLSLNLPYIIIPPPLPRELSSRVYIGITLSVRLSVHIHVRPITFFWFDIGLPYLAHLDDVSRTFMIRIWPWTFTLRSNLWGPWLVFVSGPLIFFFDWHLAHRWLSCVHSYSRFDDDLWPLAYHLAHVSITMRGCVKYIHDPDTTLNFDFKVKFIGFMTWLCVQASAFLSVDIVIHCLAREGRCVTYIHKLYMTLTFDLNIKIIFSPWIWVLQNVFALWHMHTIFWRMGVSPWNNMCTFLT